MKTIVYILVGMTSLMSFTSNNTYWNENSPENNKRLVLEFYQQFFGDKDITAADRYIGDIYIQHNPAVMNGKETLKNFFTPLFKDAPKTKVDIRHVATDGDLVWLHVRTKNLENEIATVDIFRLENGKIVEHWDVNQNVPKKSANDNTMF